MNVKLLRRIQKHILEEPLRLVMGTVRLHGKPGTPIGDYAEPSGYNANNEFERVQPFASCGTAACIIGWAEALTPSGNPRGINFSKLVAVEDWPRQFSRRYSRAKLPVTRAKIAAARIEHFIATNGAE